MPVPDYQGGSIVNLMASLEAGLRGAPVYPPSLLLSPERVAMHRQVLLLVVDGLGYEFLRRHPEAVNLNAHLAGAMTSVFPTTTTTAITTYLTGDAPQQHGLTGWHMYFRELGSVMAVLPAKPRFGGCTLGESGIDMAALLGTRPFPARIKVPAHMVSPDFIAGSDFSRAHLGGATQHPYADLDDMLARCGEVLRRPGAKYLYAYWPRLDSLGHRHGIGSTPVAEHLVELDRAFARLLELAEGTDTLILLTADHGQVDPPAHRRIDLADHPALADCLSLPLCGEPRIAYCYLRAGMEQVFDDYVTEHLGDAVLLYTAQELVDSGLFGTGAPHAELDRRVGDRALLMRKDYAIRDWLPHERRFNMVGMHGGLSRDEMLVPLVMADA